MMNVIFNFFNFFSSFNFFLIHVVCLCSSLWVMTNLLYIHIPGWSVAPYFSISAQSCHSQICGLWGIPS